MASVADSFTYANGELSTLNSAWVEFTAGFTVDSNRVRADGVGGTTTTHQAHRLLDSADQRVEIGIPVVGDATEFAVVARVSTIGTDPGTSGPYYRLRYIPASGVFDLRSKAASSTTHTLIASTTVTLTDGDAIALEVEGTTYRAYTRTGGSWTLQLTGTNSTISTGNYVGIQIVGSTITTTRLDDFTANDLVTTQDITPTGIPSGEAFGTPVVSDGTLALYPTGIASGEAFGTAVVSNSAPQTIAPAGIPDPDELFDGLTDGIGQFGIPTVTLSTGAQIIAPTGIASGEAFGTVVVDTVAVTHRFTPPTETEIRWVDRDAGLYIEGTVGITVINEGGAYRQVLYPAQSELEAADGYYLGGHLYEITAAEKTALEAAGYGAYITTS